MLDQKVSSYSYTDSDSESDNEFILHATLEPGAEGYFSGIRVGCDLKDLQALSALVLVLYTA